MCLGQGGSCLTVCLTRIGPRNGRGCLPGSCQRSSARGGTGVPVLSVAMSQSGVALAASLRSGPGPFLRRRLTGASLFAGEHRRGVEGIALAGGSTAATVQVMAHYPGGLPG